MSLLATFGAGAVALLVVGGWLSASPASAQDCSLCANSVVISECVDACFADWYKTHPYRPSPIQYTFGALAVGTSNPAIYQFSYGARTQAEAQALALGACSKMMPGGQICRLAVQYRNACGAIALGDRGAWGSGWAYTQRQAGKEAVKSCQTAFGRNCRMASASCSER